MQVAGHGSRAIKLLPTLTLDRRRLRLDRARFRRRRSRRRGFRPGRSGAWARSWWKARGRRARRRVDGASYRIYDMRLVWNEPKRRSNLDKHGLDFADLTLEFFQNAVISSAEGAAPDGDRPASAAGPQSWSFSLPWEPRRCRSSRCAPPAGGSAMAGLVSSRNSHLAVAIQRKTGTRSAPPPPPPPPPPEALPRAPAPTPPSRPG